MPVVIELQHVERSFRGHFWQRPATVLHDLSFTVKEGEIFGFLGPNGAGKTTTIKLVTGLIRADRGAVRIWGMDPRDQEVKRRLGFLPELPYYYEHLTGLELLAMHAALASVPDQRAQAQHLLEQVGLAEAGSNRIRTYSRGMLQRLGCAIALVGEPRLLVLDEPLSGLDPIGRKDIKDLIFAQKKLGRTVFFSSHILPDAEEICDRVGVIVGGKILRIGLLNELLKDAPAGTTLEQWFVETVRHDQ